MTRSSWRYAWMIALTSVLTIAQGACADDGDDSVDVDGDSEESSARTTRPITGAPAGAGASAGAGANAGNGANATAAIDRESAQLVLAELASTVDATVVGFSSTPTAGEGEVGAQAAVEVACASGGGARVSGRVNVVPAPVMVDVDVAIAFNACLTRGGSAIAGSLQFTQAVDAGPGTPLRIATRYRGEVELSGRLQLRCSVDVNVLVDEAGQALDISGEVCGQDAAELSVQVTPHWQVQ